MPWIDPLRATRKRSENTQALVPVAAPVAGDTLQRSLEIRASNSVRSAWHDAEDNNIFKPRGRGALLSFDTMRRMYHHNSIVRMVVDTIVRQITSLEHTVIVKDKMYAPPWKVYYARDLFAAPNDTVRSYSMWLHPLLRDLLVCDQFALEVTPADNGWPGMMWVMDAATVLPRYDEHRRLQGYTQRVHRGFTTAESVVEFKPNEIVYAQGNPLSYRKLSLAPLESLTLEIAGDLYAMKRNVDFFTEGFHQEAIAFLDDVSQDEAERIQAAVSEMYKGQQPGFPIIGAKGTISQLSPSNRDMQFTEFEHWLLQRTCGVFQIETSQVIVLQALATKATGQQQENTHQSKALAPLMTMLEDVFTSQVLAYIDPALRFSFSEDSKINDANEATVAQANIASGAETINEVRVRSGREPFVFPVVPGPDGDGDVCIFDLPWPYVVAAGLGGMVTPADVAASGMNTAGSEFDDEA